MNNRTQSDWGKDFALWTETPRFAVTTYELCAFSLIPVMLLHNQKMNVLKHGRHSGSRACMQQNLVDWNHTWVWPCMVIFTTHPWLRNCGSYPAELSPAYRAGHVIAAAILFDPATTAWARLRVVPHPLRGILFVFFPHVC